MSPLVQEPDLADSSWWQRNRDRPSNWEIMLGALAVFLITMLVLVVVTGPAADAGTPDVGVTIVTETDDAGRVCTTATTATSVAIDCDFPPAENRVGDWLDGFGEQP